MNLLLQRYPTTNDWMFGSLFVEGKFECFTLEDELRENKVQAETAIPASVYELFLEDSPQFGPDTITFKDVHGFKYIRVHGGNTDDDTKGCVIVGDQIDEKLGRISGAQARGVLTALKAKIVEAIRERGEQVWIEVRNAAGDKYVDTGNPVRSA